MKNSLKISMLVAASAFAGLAGMADVNSNFDANSEGWTLIHADPASTLTYEVTDGDPAGYLLFTDASQGHFDGFSAPAKFLGNDSSFVSLSFDLFHVGPGPQVAQNPLTITDVAGDKISIVIAKPTANTWTPYDIPFSPVAGFIFDGHGLATQHQIDLVLSDVKSISIPADLRYFKDLNGLDNVTLHASSTVVPEPSVWALIVLSLVALPLMRKKLRPVKI